MRRRSFIAAVGATAAAWPLLTRASDRLPRIGYLSPAPADADKPLFEAFEVGLGEFGLVPGQTVAVEARFVGGDDEKLSAQARELVGLGVDVIVTIGPGVFIAHKAGPTIPIVMAAYGAIDELVSMGLVASLAHPGGVVTGQTFLLSQLFMKRVELLKQVKPAMTRVGLLVLRGSVFNQFRPALEAQIRALGLVPEPIEISAPDDCDATLASGPGASIGGLLVPEEPQFSVGPGPAAIAAAALRHRVPAAGPFSFAASGGLFSYDVDLPPMARRAAYFVDRILKGAKPGDIPTEQATKFVTIINLQTAKALGIDLPPTLLAAADEVIE